MVSLAGEGTLDGTMRRALRHEEINCLRQVGLVDLFVFPWTAPLTAAVLRWPAHTLWLTN